MRTTLAILMLALGSVAVHAQTTGRAAATTCSIANTAPNVSNIHIVCGIGQQQGKQILGILNTILSNQLDTDAVMKKLDELITMGSGQQTTVNGSVTQQNGGGCHQQVVGGNDNTNNCVPPARHLTSVQDSGIQLLAAQLPDGCQVRFNSADNGESQNFEKELHDAFNKTKKTADAGWGISWHPKITLIVRVKTADDSCASYGLILAKGLMDLNIASEQPTLDDKLPAKTVEILVGEL